MHRCVAAAHPWSSSRSLSSKKDDAGDNGVHLDLAKPGGSKHRRQQRKAADEGDRSADILFSIH